MYYFNFSGLGNFIEFSQSLLIFNKIFCLLLCVFSFFLFAIFVIYGIGLICFHDESFLEIEAVKKVRTTLCGLLGLTTVVYFILLLIYPEYQICKQVLFVFAGAYAIPFLCCLGLGVAFVFGLYCIYKPIMAVKELFGKK